MGYRIEYGQTVKYETDTNFKNNKNVAYIIVSIVAAIVFLLCIGTDSVRSLLLPGDPQITEQALNTFAQQVRAGESFGNAAEAFCREIIAGADIA